MNCVKAGDYPTAQVDMHSTRNPTDNLLVEEGCRRRNINSREVDDAE